MCANKWNGILSAALPDRNIAAYSWAFLNKSHVWMLSAVWLSSNYYY